MNKTGSSEQFKFISIQEISGKTLAVMTTPYTTRGLDGQVRFDENNLRIRLSNLKKAGHPHDQTEKALEQLVAKIKSET